MEKGWSNYRVGYDPGNGKSYCGFAVVDKRTLELKYITRYRWKAKLGLWIARILGVEIIQEINK